MKPEILRLSHFSTKAIPSVQFSDFSLSLLEGEIHCVVGLTPDQRAVLTGLLAGRFHDGTGTLFLHGRETRFDSPAQALSQGLYCIRQRSALIDRMSIMENLFILPFAQNHGLVTHRHILTKKCKELLERFGVLLDPDTLVGELRPFGHTAIELLRAVALGATIILYNQEIDALSDQDFHLLSTLLFRFTAENISVLLLSGSLTRMQSVGDRISVTKEGMSIKSFLADEIDHMTLLQIVMGHSKANMCNIQPVSDNAPALQINGLHLQPNSPSINLYLQRGEIVGLIDFSLRGADQVLRTLYGLQPCEVPLEIHGRTVMISKPSHALKHGLFFLHDPESDQLLLPTFTLRDNIALCLCQSSALPLGIIRRKFVETEVTEAAIQIGLDAKALNAQLSPGDYLRTHLGRILLSHSSILLMEHPFSGLSVEGSLALRRFMQSFVQHGGSILFSSTSLSEITEMCNRYYTISGDTATEKRLNLQGESPLC